MHRAAVILVLTTLLLAGFPVAAAGKSKSPEDKKAEEMRKLGRRLDRDSAEPPLTPERRFLHASAADMLKRAEAAPAGSFAENRLLDAADDLLDGSEEIAKSGKARPCKDKDEHGCDSRPNAARDLEHTFFRIMEGEYFARRIKAADGGTYLKTARQLYQLGRNAYDGGDYTRARRLAQAAREVADALEALAQADVPVPEPPTLKE